MSAGALQVLLPAPGADWLLLVAFDPASAAVCATMVRTGRRLVVTFSCFLFHLRLLHLFGLIELEVQFS